MDKNFEIEKTGQIQAANFSNDRNRDYLQHKIIVRMLSESIKNQKPITSDDIIDAYVEWRFDGIKEMYGYKQKWNGLEYKYVPVTITPEDFRKEWNIKVRAKTWFKNNLGGAIIKGKVLAIPVIEI